MSKVAEFLALYNSKSTVHGYRYALAEYFKDVYGKNENRVEEYGERYFKETRNFEDDLNNFLSTISSRPPKSIRFMIAVVRTFLVENNVELSQKFWRRLRGRIKGNRARTIDQIPSNKELKKIMTHLPVHGQSLYLTLSSSGMRIGEALKLQLEDVDLTEEPARIQIRGEYTKSGNPRIAFISNEAKEAINEWLKNRSRYLEAAVKKSRIYTKNSEDARLYPFEKTTAYSMWHKALRDTKLGKKDHSTNRHKIHPHVLRKFFRTKLGSVIPVDVAEALMGHEGYLTEVYRKYSVEDLAKFYLQGEHSLHVFGEAEEIGKLRTEVEDRNKQLQSLVNGLTAKNLRQENELEDQKGKLVELKRKQNVIVSQLKEVTEVLDGLKTLRQELENLRDKE